MSGYTNEVLEETHDLIHHAEEEEQRAHPGKALTQPDSGEDFAGLGSSASSGTQKSQTKQSDQSLLGKAKEALNLK